MTQYIADEAHFKEVIARVPKVKRSLWIGTAYIGSANLTGAGIGMKSTRTRNPSPQGRDLWRPQAGEMSEAQRADEISRSNYEIIKIDM